MRFSSDYSNVSAGFGYLSEGNKIPYSDQVEEFCWKHFEQGPDFLVNRYENGKDLVVKDTEIYTVYQLGNTRYQYRVRETGGLPGVKLDAIWKEEEEYEEGELDL